MQTVSPLTVMFSSLRVYVQNNRLILHLKLLSLATLAIIIRTKLWYVHDMYIQMLFLVIPN